MQTNAQVWKSIRDRAHGLDCTPYYVTYGHDVALTEGRFPYRYRATEAVGGGWIVLENGFQIGGNVGPDGTGDAVFATLDEAFAFACEHAKA